MKRKLTAFAAAFALAALAGIAHAQQTPAPQPAKAENAAERKPIYYRNPMGLPDISPVPKKDSMGMDYIPVYADEATATSPAPSTSVSIACSAPACAPSAPSSAARAPRSCPGGRQA